MWKRVKKLYNPHAKKSRKENDTYQSYDINAINNNNNDCDNNRNAVNTGLEQGDEIAYTEHSKNEIPTSATAAVSPMQQHQSSRLSTASLPSPPTEAIPISPTTNMKKLLSTSGLEINATSEKVNNSLQKKPKHNHIKQFRKHFLKKQNDKSAKNRSCSVPVVSKPNSLSKSTGDLTDRRHSSSSMVTLRESRRSVITQLDDYIKHLKQSIDEGNIASAPRRLCCAQLLRTVYLRREQQCQYESLHNINNNDNNNSNNHHHHSHNYHRHHCNRHSPMSLHKNTASVPDFRWSSVTRAQSQILHSSSFDSSNSSHPTVKWHQGSPSDSECSSMGSNEYDTHYNQNDCNEFSSPGYRESDNCNNKNGFCNHSNKYDSVCSLNEEDNECDEHSSKVNTDDNSTYFREHSLNGVLSKKGSHRKSVPIFPQAIDIDIY